MREPIVGLYWPQREPRLGADAAGALLDGLRMTYELRANPATAEGCDAALVMLPHDGGPPESWHAALLRGPRDIVQVHPSPKAPLVVPMIWKATSLTQALVILRGALK